MLQVGVTVLNRSSKNLILRRVVAQRRPFFASSTDHTRLLAESEVHCLPTTGTDGEVVQQFVLVAGGTDPETVQKVPQLHLARINVREKDRTLFGCKVVNKTLGDMPHVCSKLVDAALEKVGPNARAQSSLHGLSEWVLKGLAQPTDDGPTPELLTDLTKSEQEAVGKIANGKDLDDDSTYKVAKQPWERLAREFVAQGQGAEAALYQSKGAQLQEILHQADQSEFSNTSGGAMALFTF